MTLQQIIDAQMLAFNNRDIKNMMLLYTDDIKILNFSDYKITVDGFNECQKMFTELFDNSPNLYAEILDTIIFDNKVIAKEFVSGRNGNSEKKEQVVIFEINNEKISRMDLIKEHL
ncbi:nuclear transport factor 2 family protein [Flavobacterium sp. MC2016-06]|uniref:nuclear transport factor 2 family protein n=1 Tax=Flavobacterium sp. MC2016-06 TaxID=2676308 RepID=UPI0012BACF1F|nr:nuclear transport factor 2 family protein [Flavobacterium sp. MC2016-06]MBU3858325.1 nuclear transport factor 2 family protein [Flavobacterium sp. MC2016-06]